MNFNKLPLELVDYIKSYAVDMTDYAYYTTLKWVEIETFLNNMCNEHMIEKIDEILGVDDFKRINWKKSLVNRIYRFDYRIIQKEFYI